MTTEYNQELIIRFGRVIESVKPGTRQEGHIVVEAVLEDGTSRYLTVSLSALPTLRSLVQRYLPSKPTH